jgi:hypothetical protein
MLEALLAEHRGEVAAIMMEPLRTFATTVLERVGIP